MESLARFLAGLLPEHDASPEEHYRYMLRLGLTVSCLVLLLVGETILDWGMVPAFPGFARSSDVTQVIGEVRATRSQDLESELLDLQTKACQAKSDEARQSDMRLIIRAEDDYDYLNPGHPYAPLACSQL
jgi:hypothetical protein